MITKKELLSLLDAYNNGELSFAQIFLASGWTVKQICRLIKNEGIPISINVGFQDKGKGLDEDALKMILENYD